MTISKSATEHRMEFKKNLNVLCCLICLVLCSTFYYGFRVITLTLVSVAVSEISSWVSNKLRGKIINLSDLSPVVSGVMFSCLLAPSSDYWLVIFGAIFSQIVVLFPFGGKDNCRINETAAAFCFCAISWSTRIFRYPSPFTSLSVIGDIPLDTLTTSPAATLHLGGKPIYSIWEMMLGAVPGSIGTASIIIIIASFFFLLSRKNGGWQMSLATVVSFFAASLFFCRTNLNPFISAFYELFSGSVMFCAVFLVPESEKFFSSKTASVIYSVFVGVIAVLFRYFGGFEEGICFSILLCSLVLPLFDLLATKAKRCFDKNKSLIGGLKREKGN